jgi:hypothetical protein
MEKTNFDLTIYVGDIGESLGLQATLFDAGAYLVNKKNYKKFLSTKLEKNTTIFTSLGDFPKNLKFFYDLLCVASKIVYCPPDVWSDNKQISSIDPSDSMQGLTEIFLLLLPSHTPVENFTPKFLKDPVHLVDVRKSAHKQLWIAGCSISHGKAVLETQRYGRLVADSLGLPCSFLTKPGSALDWATDQLLRSDIKENDIVIWGLTSPQRLTRINNDQLLNISIVDFKAFSSNNPKLVTIDEVDCETTIYKHFYMMQQVINFCAKCKAHLILVGLMLGNYVYLDFLKSKNNYVHVNYPLCFDNNFISPNFLDTGSDGKHPGPVQHQQYANLILSKIKELQIIV